MPPAGVMADQIVITEKFSQAISSSTEMQNRACWFRTSEATLRAAQ
jgi:hypothetical protein